MQQRAARFSNGLRGVCWALAVAGLSLAVLGSNRTVSRAQSADASFPVAAGEFEGTRAAVAGNSAAPSPSQGIVQSSTEPVSTAPQVLIKGELGRGDTLARALKRQGVGAATIHQIATAMSEHFDFRRAQPGHGYRLVVETTGQLVDFRYLTSETEGFRMVRDEGGFRVEAEEAELVARVSRLTGAVAHSLYESIRDLGHSPQLASDFADIFAWDVDFSRSIHAGDEFKVLYERIYRVDSDGSETFVRPGKILAAQFDGHAGHYAAVYFEEEPGRGGYFRTDGTSVERSFLLAPLRYGRISSRYTSARLHPILKITRPHYGIDYAAPANSPVWAVGDGKVIYRAWAGGFGNLVKVRHPGGYVSYYAHLSRFAKGQRVGDRVDQKQVIGYVGSTGLSTGPHVDFRMTHHGRYMDPKLVPPTEGRPVPYELAHLFEGTRDILMAELDGAPLFAVDEAF